ncbi:MAG: hypothetical protein EXR99_07165 [Gemmataceae bacterium]|nr:hypothetical protein [Gemmataceae bacterium]
MKLNQGVIAAIILGAMVFGLTFAMQFVGGLGGDKDQTVPVIPKVTNNPSDQEGTDQELTFRARVMPEDGQSMLENEFKAGGQQDYWFTHEGTKPLRVGLEQKNCTCTNVRIFQIDKSLATPYLSADGGKIDLAKLEMAAKDPKLKAQMEANAKVSQLEKDETPVLAPGTTGWVRLQWKTEKMGQQRLTATLWMGKKGSANDARLEALTMVRPGLLVDQPEKSVDVLSPLVSEKKIFFNCISSTREKFELLAKITRPRPDETLTIGKPEPMTDKELQEERTRMEGVPVLSGYRVPVTVSYSVPGGKDLMELGPFTRQLEFLIGNPATKESEIDTKVEVRVTGRVEGEFRVLDSEQKGRLSFGVFQRTLGIKKDIKVETELTGVELQLDPAKTSQYLKVRAAPGWPQDLGGRRTWRFFVDILPDIVSGPFPRDDEFYRDSAIYLKSPGANPRSIRIPVDGRADN